MTDKERITMLEQRLANLEARMAEMERRQNPMPPAFLHQLPYKMPQAGDFQVPPFTTTCGHSQ